MTTSVKMAAPCGKLASSFFTTKWLALALCRRYTTKPPPSFGIPHSALPKNFREAMEEPKLEPSFTERMTEHAEPEVSVDIGEKYTKPTFIRQEYMRLWKSRRNNTDLERAARKQTLEVDLAAVSDVWSMEQAPHHLATLAHHYAIYRDLFNGATFTPCVQLHVNYDVDEDHVMPVHRGNRISPTQAANPPNVSFDAEEDTLWTLILTNPDGHLTDNSAEYLHWMVGNIRGSDIASGETLCSYLQPFPPRGTGLHRHVFVLFKQKQQIDYSQEQRPPNCCSLSERTFFTSEFFLRHQDVLTPVGLAFFQSEHDASVRHVYHHMLDMREPVFEYDHPPVYHPPQKTYPHRQPFDRYYDKYRDKKDLAEEVMRKKMELISPFEEYQRPRLPLIHKDFSRPSWLRKREALMHRRREQFTDLPS